MKSPMGRRARERWGEGMGVGRGSVGMGPLGDVAESNMFPRVRKRGFLH